jgi:hypothetical protein
MHRPKTREETNSGYDGTLTISGHVNAFKVSLANRKEQDFGSSGCPGDRRTAVCFPMANPREKAIRDAGNKPAEPKKYPIEPFRAAS